jgi:hypothetical protein
MNQDIQKALLDLFSVCLELTSAGRLNAHMTYSPHVNAVQVYVLPGSTNYSNTADRNYLLDETVYLSGSLAGTEEEVIGKLRALADRVSGLQLPAQEVAA